MKVSEVAEFESIYCEKCSNHNFGNCAVLNMLGAMGICDVVIPNGSGHNCLMHKHRDLPNKEEVIKWVDVSQSYEVEEVLIFIKESYHYDVINRRN